MHTSRKEKEGSIKTCEEMEFPDTKPWEGPSPLDTPGARPCRPRVPGHRMGIAPA